MKKFVLWYVGAALAALVAVTFMNRAEAHTDKCDGIEIHDIRQVDFVTWYKVTELIHVIDDDGSVSLHWQSSPRWVRADDIPCDL